MKTMLWAVLSMGMAVSVAWGEDMVDNPEYKNWAAFKPGTTVKQKSTTSLGETDPEAEAAVAATMEMASTLKEVTAEKVVVEVVTKMEVNGAAMSMPSQKQEIAAKIAKSAANRPEAPPGVKLTKKGEGDEEVTVGGKKYKCHWTEYQMSGDQFEATSKSWNCDKVPGGVVKMVVDSTQPMKSKTTVELVEFTPGS